MNTVGYGESGMNWERSMEAYITIHTIDGGNLLHDADGSMTTYRGGMGGGGREFQEGEDVCIPVADSW